MPRSLHLRRCKLSDKESTIYSHPVNGETNGGADKRCADRSRYDRASKSASAFGRRREFYMNENRKTRHEKEVMKNVNVQ